MTLANILYGSKPQIIRTGLVLYLPLHQLDGASFMSKDHYGHLCTVTGATWGLRGRTFDGTDDFINVPDHPLLDNTTSLLFLVWIWIDGNQNDKAICNKDGALDRALAITLLSSGKVDFYATNTANAWDGDRLSSANYPLSTWVHYGFYFAGSTNLDIYKNADLDNGSLIGSIPTKIRHSASDLGIGGLSGAINMKGIIGEFLLYNPAPSISVITRHYLTTKWRYQ